MKKILNFIDFTTLFQKKYFAIFLILVYILFCQSCVKMRMSPKAVKDFFVISNVKYIDSLKNFANFQIHYIETGNSTKPILLFVHGSPGSWDAFKKYMIDPQLCSKFRMIAVDRSGFGYSDFGEAQNLQSQSQRIYEFLKSFKSEKPINLIGHSLGGPLVAKLAVDYPTAFSDVIILSGALDPLAENPEKWRPILMSKPLRYLVPGALRPSNDELWWLKSDLFDLKTSLKNIVANVIIVHGTKDRLVPFSNVKFMQLYIENAQKITVIPINDADHFIPWTHFDTVRDVILSLKI